MEKIMFFADAACDLVPEDYAGKPLRLNSAVVMYEGKVEREIEIDRLAYFNYLKKCKEVPTTAMATPDEWLEGYIEAYENGYTHAIGITISSTGSAVIQNADLARKMFLEKYPDGMKFTLFDSRGYSMIYGQVILEALELNEQGKSYDEIADRVRDRLHTSQGILTVFSLTCMKKSGRISGMSAFVGDALGIKPILLGRDGKIAPVDKVRGEKNLAPKLVEQVKSRIVNPEEQVITLVYSLNPESVLSNLEELLLEGTGCKGIRRHILGGTVGTNSGPDTIAIIYHGEPFETELLEIRS